MKNDSLGSFKVSEEFLLYTAFHALFVQNGTSIGTTSTMIIILAKFACILFENRVCYLPNVKEGLQIELFC
jgi:hypothetical protein